MVQFSTCYVHLIPRGYKKKIVVKHVVYLIYLKKKTDVVEIEFNYNLINKTRQKSQWWDEHSLSQLVVSEKSRF